MSAPALAARGLEKHFGPVVALRPLDLRVEVAGFGIQVVIVEPGFFRTNIGAGTRERAEEHGGRESPYRRAYERVTGMVGWLESLAPSPELVARTIVTSIESRRPRQRYVVGLDALATVATQPFTPRSRSSRCIRGRR